MNTVMENSAAVPADDATLGGTVPLVVSVADRVSRYGQQGIEALLAILVAIETIILFSGAISRYVFEAPLLWSDELAAIIFLWLGMLGATVAYFRLEHMRMGVFVDRAQPKTKAFFDAFASLAGLAFVGAALPPAIEYVIGEIPALMPALEISSFWKALAIPVGLGLIFVAGVLRLARSTKPVNFVLALLALAIVAGVLIVAKPVFVAMGNYNLIIFFVVLLGAGVLTGIPIAFSFGLGSYAFLALMTHIPLTVVVNRMGEGMSHSILLAVPLFVFLGLLLEITGMARAIVAFLASLIGHMRGGLQYVLVGAIYLISGISGSKAADMAAVAPVLFPEMKARGAEPGDLGALLAATTAQTETIPPSLVLITIGSVTGVSIAALFTGGLLPSLVCAVTLCAVLWFQFRGQDTSKIHRATRAEICRLFAIALPALVLPFLIRAAVVEGVTTATEVSTIGIFYCLVYALIASLVFRQRIPYRRIWPSLIETGSLTGAILLIIGTATGMAWALTQSGFSHQLVAAMTSLPGGALTFMAASILAFLLLGSLLEGIPAIVLFGPLLFPAARAVGIHEVQYAMVAVLAMGIGLFAPPIGVGYYAACVIGRVDPMLAMKPIIPYLIALFIATIVIAAVPWISIGFL